MRALNPDIVFAFFAIDHAHDRDAWGELRALVPGARWIGCSSAGEIGQYGVANGGVALAAVRFDHTRVGCARAALSNVAQSRQAGVEIARALRAPELKAIIMFGPGVGVNGSAMIDGLSSELPPDVSISGGLAADDGAFKHTWTMLDDSLQDRQAVAVGLYGSQLRVGHGSFGGWQPFGPVREVTHATANLLHELDGEPALQIYRRYLGEYAHDLPASGLLFPFGVLNNDPRQVELVRTILGIDETAGSLVMAGDIAQGSRVRLMHASTNSLIDGANAAARAAADILGERDSGFALLVSCIGRKLVMGGRVDDEVDAVAAVFGQRATISGFYSNGEISPFVGSQVCRLHNQTMTVTCLSE